MQIINGHCHCGAVAFEIKTELTEFTKCDCSLCRMKNAVMTKVHETAFRLLRGEDVLATYEWNTMTAKHHFCSRCGIYTFHRKRVTPDYFGINVYCLHDVDISQIPVRDVDGLSMSKASAD